MKRSLARYAAVLVALTASCITLPAKGAEAVRDSETAYALEINRRAEKIVANLGLAESDKAARVQKIISRQYRDLREIHDARDAKTNAARNAGSAVEIKGFKDDAEAKLKKLHAEYVSRLSAELSPDQVEKVKDGMTYGVLPLIYDTYLRMCPDLTEAQKAQVRAWLVEARERAMDGGSSEEKHAWFGKYKGKINNYLSAAGYDLKQAEKNLKTISKDASERKPK